MNHPVLVEEWKLNLDTAAYEQQLDDKVNIPSDKKEIDCNYDRKYWPISIK